MSSSKRFYQQKSNEKTKQLSDIENLHEQVYGVIFSFLTSIEICLKIVRISKFFQHYFLNPKNIKLVKTISLVNGL